MKLRIKGNSLRLRLTQTEVDEISDGNTVTETVSFGSQSPAFHYGLIADEHAGNITAYFNDCSLQIVLPFSQAKQWAISDEVGLERDILLDDGSNLYVLIEKDFQCLHQRPREDEQDNFPNPKTEEV